MTATAQVPATTLQVGVASYGGRYTRPRGRRTTAAATTGAVALATALVLSACAGPASDPAAGGRDEQVVVQPDTPFDPLEAPVDAPRDTPADDEPPAQPEPEPEPEVQTRVRLGSAANRDRARFGEVAEGESVTRSFAVRVDSADPSATVDAAVTGDPEFTLGGTTCDPAEGQRRECRVDVTFAPQAPGGRSGTLTVTVDGAAPARLSLTGRAADAAPELSPEPSAPAALLPASSPPAALVPAPSAPVALALAA